MSMSMTGQVGGSAGGANLGSAVDLLQKKVDALETRMGHTMSSARGKCVESDILDLRKMLQALTEQQVEDVAQIMALFREKEDRQLRFACLAHAATANPEQDRSADEVIEMAGRFMEWVKNGT